MNMIASNGYHFCIHVPTRVDSSSALVNNKILTNQSYSDHAPLVLTIGFDGKNTIKYQNFRDTSFLKSPKKVTDFLEIL